MTSREQFQQGLKALVVQRAREIAAQRDEMAAQARDAKTLFETLRDAPTWSILQTQKPKGFKPPDSEIWSQPVIVKGKGPGLDDDAT